MNQTHQASIAGAAAVTVLAISGAALRDYYYNHTSQGIAKKLYKKLRRAGYSNAEIWNATRSSHLDLAGIAMDEIRRNLSR